MTSEDTSGSPPLCSHRSRDLGVAHHSDQSQWIYKNSVFRTFYAYTVGPAINSTLGFRPSQHCFAVGLVRLGYC